MNKRRFIAGAVCPECKLVDKLVTYEREGAKVRECVRCGYEDVQRFDQAKPEITTRVNKAKHERDDEVRPVRIL